MGQSTIPPDAPVDRARQARFARRIFIVVLCAFLLAGVLGMLGVRTATVHGEGGGYQLEVRYAKVARSGLSVPWVVTIRHPGGFSGPVTLATNSEYFDMLDENSFDPEPESTTSDGERLIWQFQPPEGGDTMEVALDTRVGLNVQLGTTGTTEVLEGGAPVATVEYKTWIMP
ncbi:MAG TPA: hypothetical protein VHM89_00805 [Acidimicrobiales bacterium]|nr:hypothetical protein [Acidimicrobiales bacterium]